MASGSPPWCTPGTGGSGGEDGKSFEFWSFAAVNQEASVDAYRGKHPDIEVKLTEVGTSTETAQALTTALAGGKVPDLVLVQGDNLPKFAQQPQNFVDLRTPGATDVEGDHLDRVVKQSIAEDGEVLDVPTDVGGTERGHTVAVARARSPRGPWDPAPSNPIPTHRGTAHSVQSTGHADLVTGLEGRGG